MSVCANYNEKTNKQQQNDQMYGWKCANSRNINGLLLYVNTRSQFICDCWQRDEKDVDNILLMLMMMTTTTTKTMKYPTWHFVQPQFTHNKSPPNTFFYIITSNVVVFRRVLNVVWSFRFKEQSYLLCLWSHGNRNHSTQLFERRKTIAKKNETFAQIPWTLEIFPIEILMLSF